MAKAPKIAVPSDDTIMLAGEDQDGINEIALDSVLNTLESDQTEAKVWVWRSDPDHSGKGGAKDAYIKTMSPSDFQEYGLEGLKAEYGEGVYRIRIHAAGGGLLLNRIFRIAPLSASEKRDNETRQREQEILHRRELSQIPQSTQAPNGEQGFVMLAQIMKEGFSAMAGIMTQQKGNRKEMLEELMLYKNLFAPTNGAGNNGAVTDPFAMMKSALELVQELGAGKNGGETTMLDGFIRLADKFAPAITEIVKAKVDQPVQLPAILTTQNNNPPAAIAAAAAAQSEPAQPQEHDPMKLLLRFYVPMLVQQARAGNDPFKYADMILDQVDANIAAQFANRPDYLEFLAGFDPAIREPAISTWFEQLRKNVLELLTQDAKELNNVGTDGISTDSLQ
jgi:hypothetical protein